MKDKEETESVDNLKKYLLWVVDRKRYIFFVLAGILLSNILIFKLKPLIIKKSVDTSILANQSYNDWKKTSFKDADKLIQLKSHIGKHPNLKPNYEGLILQNLLINKNFTKEENKIAKNALERTKAELPFYYEFSKVAIMINNGKIKQALNKSKELKTKMLKDLSFLQGDALPAGAVLFSLNLLRIALLESKLKNNNNEYIAWQELENYLHMKSGKTNDNIKAAIEAMKDIFNENGLELIDYIQYRKDAISSMKS